MACLDINKKLKFHGTISTHRLIILFFYKFCFICIFIISGHMANVYKVGASLKVKLRLIQDNNDKSLNHNNLLRSKNVIPKIYPAKVSSGCKC